MTPPLGSRHLRSFAIGRPFAIGRLFAIGSMGLGWLVLGSLAAPFRAAAAPSPASPAPPAAPVAASQPQNPAEQAPPLTITIDDLAGPKGPGSPTPKHPHWKVEPGAAWWGPGGDFGDGFDDGWLW